ncbi:MAG: 3-phosphoshikimate 1-carboxyvinyltransferase [Candidatus Bathyarchaeota archaeon]|nr:3-phosphoshikimate 1-carboxyvinyltransferase [Candidatus Bathyarchaeota archaeon]
MKVLFEHTDRLEGSIRSQPSKSYMIRYLIASLLSSGVTYIENPSICDDTLAVVKACEAFGARIEPGENIVKVSSSGCLEAPSDVIDCGGSATAIRFLSAVAPLAPGITVLTGDESLRMRPMGPLLDALRRLGVEAYSTRMNGLPPIVVFGGGIPGGCTWVDGSISSQYVSGLLLALPKARRDSSLRVVGELESKGYVDMTLTVLEMFRVKVERTGYSYFEVEAGQEYHPPTSCTVPGDYSSSSFIIVACSILPSKVRIHSLAGFDIQPDRMIVDIVRDLGVAVRFGDGYIEIEGTGDLIGGFEVDVRDSPDLAPPLAALACFCKGVSIIRGCRRLRFKESDRLKAISSELTRIGVEVEVDEDSIKIHGSGCVDGGYVYSWMDHRIAMAFAVIGLGSRRGVTVDGFESVSKSYPRFLGDLEALGGRFRIVG